MEQHPKTSYSIPDPLSMTPNSFIHHLRIISFLIPTEHHAAWLSSVAFSFYLIAPLSSMIHHIYIITQKLLIPVPQSCKKK